MKILNILCVLTVICGIATSCGTKTEPKWEEINKLNIEGKLVWYQPYFTKTEVDEQDLLDFAKETWRARFLTDTADNIYGFCEWWRNSYKTEMEINSEGKLKQFIVTLIKEERKIPDYQVEKLLIREDGKGARLWISMSEDSYRENFINSALEAVKKAKEKAYIDIKIEEDRKRMEEYFDKFIEDDTEEVIMP